MIIRFSRKRVLPACFILLLVALSSASMVAQDAQPGFPLDLNLFLQLDHLACLRDSLQVASVSSYDRTGGNDDGFSGAYSFVRKEGDDLVLADLMGPGVIYRIATPTPTDDLLEFYFDGEAEPRIRIPFRKLFEGSTAPFLTPLVGAGSGGNWCYLPIPYAKSCKVVLRAPKLQFYQINYATYAQDAQFPNFTPKSPPYTGSVIEKACGVLRQTGSDLSRAVAPPDAKLATEKTLGRLAPGQATTLYESNRPGRIVGLRLSPASSFAGPERAEILRITWDGESKPAVLCPVADFFGFSWGQPAARALLFGVVDDSCYAYFPMPYDKSARIELVSEGDHGPPIDFTAEVVHADIPRQANEGQFYAIWRRDDPTTAGNPFTFVNVEGRGHLVGVALQAEGDEKGGTPFFEGDDRAFIDGKLTIHGTGSEDFFNGGWYDVPGQWESRASYPLCGCLDYSRPLSRSGGYRLMLGDAYAFRRSLAVDIEHGPTGNNVPGDYAGVSYLYLEAPPKDSWSLPAIADRRVRATDRIVFKPGWYQPGFTFSVQDATVAKRVEQIDGTEVRYLSMRAKTGSDIYHSPHHLAFYCDAPEAGRYRVSLVAMLGPEQGIAQLFGSLGAAGPPVNLHATSQRLSEPLVFGELDLPAGVSRLFFRITAPDKVASQYGMDVETIELRRVKD